jgi:EAL domain-containing protein (putative c-di-GMP-specific phosphodiesterase class I)
VQRFPFDKIKINRCFVSDISERGGSSIVQAVVNVATARNMTTTVEGVESLRQQELLRGFGCTEMQGYLFSAETCRRNQENPVFAPHEARGRGLILAAFGHRASSRILPDAGG